MIVACRPFAELTAGELHDILALRCAVFVVEQSCPFQEIDGRDPEALHLTLREAALLAGYARLFAPDAAGRARIGRVVTSPARRGAGLGRQVMAAAIGEIGRRFGAVPIELAAQSHLRAFYEGFGFAAIAPEYLEDGIPHLDMRRSAAA